MNSIQTSKVAAVLACAFALTTASVGNAESWVKAGALQIPFPEEVGVRIAAANDVRAECTRYEKLAKSYFKAKPTEDLKAYLNAARRFQRMSGMNPETEAQFTLDVRALGDVRTADQISRARAAVQQQRAKAVNPELVVGLDAVLVTADGWDFGTPAPVSLKSDSLVELSKRMGLEFLPVHSQANGDAVYLSTEGLDVACDLIAGRASILAQPSVVLKIETTGRRELERLLQDVSELVRPSLELPGAPLAKTLHAGFIAGQGWNKVIGSLPRAKDPVAQAHGILSTVLSFDQGEPALRADSAEGWMSILPTTFATRTPVRVTGGR